MIRTILPILLLVSVFIFSCQSKGYDPKEYLSAKQQDAIMTTIIRYAGRAPEGATISEIFSPSFDKHYSEQQSLHQMDAFYIKGDTCYFLISRRAPSLKEKRVANGGKFVLGDKGELLYYKEVFRTFKMEPDDLSAKSLFLFKRMVKKEDLEIFERIKSQEEYIEFPDQSNYYDDQERTWKQK